MNVVVEYLSILVIYLNKSRIYLHYCICRNLIGCGNVVKRHAIGASFGHVTLCVRSQGSGYAVGHVLRRPSLGWRH